MRAAVVLHAVEFPIETERVFAAQLAYRPDQLDDDLAGGVELQALRDAIDATPDVTRSAFTSIYPGRGAERWRLTFADEANAAQQITQVMTVTPEFFALMGARAQQGDGCSTHLERLDKNEAFG